MLWFLICDVFCLIVVFYFCTREKLQCKLSKSRWMDFRMFFFFLYLRALANMVHFVSFFNYSKFWQCHNNSKTIWLCMGSAWSIVNYFNHLLWGTNLNNFHVTLLEVKTIEMLFAIWACRFKYGHQLQKCFTDLSIICIFEYSVLIPMSGRARPYKSISR